MRKALAGLMIRAAHLINRPRYATVTITVTGSSPAGECPDCGGQQWATNLAALMDSGVADAGITIACEDCNNTADAARSAIERIIREGIEGA
ncbi:hypothetical protein IU487_22315 [Nocardia puris]|nr:hypothetical protein [Nocardia puris]